MIHFLVLSISLLMSTPCIHAMQETTREVGHIPKEAELLENNGMVMQTYNAGAVQSLHI